MCVEEKFLSCRKSVYRESENSFLLSSIRDSEQENDLTLPSNCGGVGRIRHFKRHISDDWLNDPLPIDPACTALSIPKTDLLQTQVFQIASCNLDCWYCFVPEELKNAKSEKSRWFTADEMIKLFTIENCQTQIIDLSGGNPELVPEWIVSTMRALERFGLHEHIYLWSDDTLTTDYTFKFLSKNDLEYFATYKNYGKVACFKGYDEISFTFNTGLLRYLFNRQFEIFSRYIELGIDVYGYVTLTSSNNEEDFVCQQIEKFMDRLQAIHELLPLKIIPLKILIFTPVFSRLNDVRKMAIRGQVFAVNMWKEELKKRFTGTQLESNIALIKIN